MQVTDMECNNEEAIGALREDSQLSNRTKQSVYEKHMPIKKRVWKRDAIIGRDNDDNVIEKRELQDTGIRCPRCDFVIPQKRLRESGSSNVTDVQIEGLSKRHCSESNEQAGLVSNFVKDEEEKKEEGSDLFRESFVKRYNTENIGKDVTSVEHKVDQSEFNDTKKPGCKDTDVLTPNLYDEGAGLKNNLEKYKEEKKEEETELLQKSFVNGDDIKGIRTEVAAVEHNLEPSEFDDKKKSYSKDIEVSNSKCNELEGDRKRDLPVSCGKIKRENSEIAEDVKTCSHSGISAKSTSRGSFKMCPVKGETWVLFKNQGIEGSSDPEIVKNHEFDFVEILTDYDEEYGIIFAYLERVKGFVSLFRPKKGVPSLQLPPLEICRFSHKVSSYRTTGRERDGIPEGYLELDPASLPDYLIEDARKKSTLTQQHQNSSFSARKQPGVGDSLGNMTRTQYANVNLHRERNQPGLDRPFFWIECPYCNMRYQYCQGILNIALQCQSCLKPFIAYDLYSQDPPVPAKFLEETKGRSTLPQQRQNNILHPKQSGRGNSSGNSTRTQFRNQPGLDRPTFWTTCPFCTMRYKYYKDVLERAVHCQNCMKSFIAYASNV
ncbi:Dnaj heat shock amino-terminal domain protein [Thalictrum thalictroides]|uniref:Dnaj heat shock amino-terminal domain protein n=1 Tax=Thalictrum thalictroides TaxID=46969 RepID=A0A7J6X6X6_THATH|nr:Dnaj heat shock amino-terminal domain protein [Thalictrum thalictroides]